MSDGSAARVWGSALTAAGALVAGIGTTVVWTSVGLRQDLRGILESEWEGLDLPEGVAVLILSAMTLVVLMISRRPPGRSPVWAPIAIMVLGAAIVALPAWVSLRAEGRAVDDMARSLSAAAGLTVEEAIELIRTDPALALSVSTDGVWLSAAGGALVILGGTTILVGARRPETVAESA